MMRVLYGFIFTCTLLALSGCSFDPSYEAEKAFWEARKIDEQLHKENPEGLKEEHYDQIVAALDRVVSIAPMEPMAAQAQFQIAQIYLGLKKPEQARETLESIFAKFSESEDKDEAGIKNIAAQALFLVGKIHEANGELEQAEETYAILLDRYPLTTRGLETPINMIRYYKSQGNIPKMKEASTRAQSHYQDLINKYSGTSIEETVKRYSLQVYAMEGAWQDVLNFYEAEIDTNIERSETIRAKVAKADLLASRMENIPEAERIYRDLISQYPVEPITPFLKVRLGYLLLAAAKNEEAREVFNNIPVEYPENEELIVQSRFGLVSADYNDGNYEKVLKRFDDIYAEYPNNPSTLRIPLMKYIYYKRAGKSDETVQEALEEALQEYTSRWNRNGQTQSDQVAGRLLLLCLIQKKDWDTAAVHLKTLARRFPNDPNILKLMKTLYWQNSGNLAVSMQVLFDSSNDSPFFKKEDSPMQDIGETLDDSLKLE